MSDTSSSGVGVILDNNLINNNTSVNDNDLERHTDYMFLLFVNMIIFIFLFFLTYSKVKKLKIKLDREDDPKFKIVNGLIVANGIRAISLVIIILLENNTGNNPKAWLNHFFHVLPSMTFVSAYMALIYLLADYYYLLKDETNHIVFPFLRIVVVSGYTLILLIGFFTFVTQDYEDFFYLSEAVIGIVYCITGSMIIYFGQLIGDFFLEKYKYEDNNNKSKVRISKF